jgi:hypothetical protein
MKLNTETLNFIMNTNGVIYMMKFALKNINSYKWFIDEKIEKLLESDNNIRLILLSCCSIITSIRFDEMTNDDKTKLHILILDIITNILSLEINDDGKLKNSTLSLRDDESIYTNMSDSDFCNNNNNIRIEYVIFIEKLIEDKEVFLSIIKYLSNKCIDIQNNQIWKNVDSVEQENNDDKRMIDIGKNVLSKATKWFHHELLQPMKYMGKTVKKRITTGSKTMKKDTIRIANKTLKRSISSLIGGIDIKIKSSGISRKKNHIKIHN